MKYNRSFCYLLSILLLLIMAPVFNGCAVLLLGGGAAGGYAVSKDEVVGAVDAKKAKVYRAALETAKNKGIIKIQDESHGRIDVSVNDINVKIHVDQITEKSTQLKVEARNKYKMPKIQVAQDVYTDILKKVA